MNLTHMFATLKVNGGRDCAQLPPSLLSSLSVMAAVSVTPEIAVSVRTRWRHVQSRVSVEETDRLQLEADVLHRHHGPVLQAHVVVGAERVPKDYIRILYRTIGFRPPGEPVSARVLVRVVTRGARLGRMESPIGA